MSESAHAELRAGARSQEDPSTAHNGAATFAGMVMLLVGTLHLLTGIVSMVDDDFHVLRSPEAFAVDLVVWGWVHVVFGVFLILAGVALLNGSRYARSLAVVLVALSLLVNFAWLPHYPWWSVAVIGLDVLLLWALPARRASVGR